MAVKFEKVQVGDVLWSKSRGRMGNTIIKETRWHSVRVIDIDSEKKTACVSWNGNPTETYYRKQVERLYRNKPKAKEPK